MEKRKISETLNLLFPS